jgi:glycosyltransferase involved in cell wall biosynthesis
MVQEVLREMGFDSKIFVAEADAELAGRAHPFRSYRARRGAGDRTWLLYQFSIGNLMGDFVAERPEPTLLGYHCLTPAKLLEPWDAHAVHAVTVGRHQLSRLAPTAELGIAMSRFGQDELIEQGCRTTAVAPPLFDLDSFERAVDRQTLEHLRADHQRGGADLLFVGRISPSKAQHDLVKALAAYRRTYDPRARLHLVGGVSSQAYRDALGRLVADLDLAGAVNFAGSVSQSELTAYYRAADVFVSCSEHEGFCVPLLEAMYHRIPILAYAAGAVPETLGAGGVVLPVKGPALVAAGLHRLVEDAAVRQALAEAGKVRLEELSPARSRARLAAVIEETVSGGAASGVVGEGPSSTTPVRSRQRGRAAEPAGADRP